VHHEYANHLVAMHKVQIAMPNVTSKMESSSVGLKRVE
jgi:hypothetical protein